MTPLDCARGIATFLKEACKEYDEKIVNIYPGFLPKQNVAAELRQMCPAIAVRPDHVIDDKEQSTVGIVIYISVIDKDKNYSGDTLFHLMEFIRMKLLDSNPIADRFLIANGMKATVTDEQPFPLWLGYIEFDVYLPQPKNHSNAKSLAGEWGC
ncbi:MAG: hypothetical protein K6C05_04575 [Anaerovibrio sp.]|uniref:hypothetical protein n=1 Tax=Anaerovibrio sp. TaxID=1872532 RepID=UPI0025EC72AD|nr:hypothetical protein [Anaerovibrio sp.]MCR5176104.1 hypothetical protein [Anaerovibrio sp.]